MLHEGCASVVAAGKLVLFVEEVLGYDHFQPPGLEQFHGWCQLLLAYLAGRCGYGHTVAWFEK